MYHLINYDALVIYCVSHLDISSLSFNNQSERKVIIARTDILMDITKWQKQGSRKTSLKRLDNVFYV